MTTFFFQNFQDICKKFRTWSNFRTFRDNF